MILRGVPHNSSRIHSCLSYKSLGGLAISRVRVLDYNNLRANVRFFSTVRTTRQLPPLPSELTGYVSSNNQEVAPSLIASARTWLGFNPPSHSKPHSSSAESEEETEHFEQEGDYDIRLSEADSLQSIEDDIKRTQLFNAINELRQTVRLNHSTPFSPKVDDKDKPDMREFLITFNTLYEKRRLLSAVSAAELATKRHPQHKQHTLQCRAAALVELSQGSQGSVTEQKLFSLKRDDLLKTAANDMENALAAEPSAEIANQYLNLSTLVGSYADYHSLLLAKQIVSFLIAKTAKEMKDTHMRLVNLYALFSSHLAHWYAVGGHHKFRHAHTDTYVRYIVLDVIRALTASLQEHVHVPLRPIQELNVLGMLDFRSKLWMALDEKDRAISDLNLALESGPSDERLLRRANIFHDLKKYDRAIEDVTRVAEKAPLEFDLNWLANLYELNGQSDKVLILWRFILAYSPTITTLTDGLLYSRLAGVANHARLYPLFCR